MSFYRLLFLVVASCFSNLDLASSQVNCLIFDEDSGERIACELSHRAIKYRQGSRASQLLFDHAIRIGPKFAWAYYEKSVPFFKRGMLAEGVSLINKAIELEPQNYLYYRAYWYFYNRSYDHCIKDLEALYEEYSETYTTSPGGELEMRLILALSLANTGKVSKGIEWVKNLISNYQDQPHLKGQYDHYCLGLLYFHNKQFDLAKIEFEQQQMHNDRFADTYYYLGLVENSTGNRISANKYFQQSLAKMNRENGGYSINIFEGFNINKEHVEQALFQSL